MSGKDPNLIVKEIFEKWLREFNPKKVEDEHEQLRVLFDLMIIENLDIRDCFILNNAFIFHVRMHKIMRDALVTFKYLNEQWNVEKCSLR